MSKKLFVTKQDLQMLCVRSKYIEELSENLKAASKDYKSRFFRLQQPLVQEIAEANRKKILKELKKRKLVFKDSKKGFTLKNTEENNKAIRAMLLKMDVVLHAIKSQAYRQTGIGYEYEVPYEPSNAEDKKRLIELFFPLTFDQVFIRINKKTGEIDKYEDPDEEEEYDDDDEDEEESEKYFSYQSI